MQQLVAVDGEKVKKMERNELKEAQTQKLQNFLFKSLNKDEISCVVKFLTIKEILFLSFTNTELFKTISLIFQEIHPIIYFNIFSNYDYSNKEKEEKNCWSLSQALKEINYLNFTKHTFDNFIHFIKTNKLNDLSKITYLFKLYNGLSSFNRELSLQKLNELFQIKLNEKQSVDCITFNEMNNNNLHKFNYEKLFLDIPLSFTIKALDLSMPCINENDIYIILSNFYNIKYLKINLFEKNYFANEVQPPVDTTFNLISIPIFKKLKTLDISVRLSNEKNVVYDLLLLSPNIEYFIFEYSHDDVCNDEFLQFLMDNCKKLKAIEIFTTSKYSNYFTDETILKLLEKYNLQKLTLTKCKSINGSLFYNIGKFAHHLKHLTIETNPTGVDLQKDIYVGGGELLNLKTIKLDNRFKELPELFFNSLYKTCPNLIEIDMKYCKDSKVDKKYILKTYLVVNEVDDYLNCENLQYFFGEFNKFPTLEQLLKCKWKKLKVLQTKFNFHNTENNNPKEWLYALLSSCPQLEEITFGSVTVNGINLYGGMNEELEQHVCNGRKLFLETIIEIFKDCKNWPNLKLLAIDCVKDLEKEIKDITSKRYIQCTCCLVDNATPSFSYTGMFNFARK